MWSASLWQLVAQVGQQSAGSPDSLRQLYRFLRLTLVDTTVVVHPACLDDGHLHPFASQVSLFAFVLACLFLLLCAGVVHAWGASRHGKGFTTAGAKKAPVRPLISR